MKKLLALMLFICLPIGLCACELTATPPVYEVSGETSSAASSAYEEDITPSVQPESEEPTETAGESILSVGYTNAYSYRDENGIIRAIGIIQVTNQSDASLSLPPCAMTFTDGNGNTVYHSDSVAAYPPVIAPAESAYYYEQFEPDLPTNSAISVEPVIPDPIPADPVRYETGEVAIMDSPYGGLVLSGTVTNTSALDGEVVCISAVLFDESGTPLAVVQTVLMDKLPVGQSSEFYIEDFLLPATVTADAVASIRTFAYPL